MSTKKSVLLTDRTVEIMQASTSQRDPDAAIAWSNQINRAVIINDWLFQSSLPDLSAEEWQVILNTYAGTIGSVEHPPYRVASDLMDDLGLIDVDDHPNADLVRRLHYMSQSQQFAILVFAERFWSGDWGDLGWDGIYRQIINS